MIEMSNQCIRRKSKNLKVAMRNRDLIPCVGKGSFFIHKGLRQQQIQTAGFNEDQEQLAGRS